MLIDVIKALFYACNSYPKVAAPHRLSLSDDFEMCILSSIIGALGLYNDVVRVVFEFKRGERGLGELEIGRNLAKSLNLCFQELKHKMLFEICLSTPALLYVDVFQSEIEKDFHKVLRKFFNAMQVQGVEDSVEFVRISRNIGGELNVLLDKAGITERRIVVEGLTIYNIFEELSKYNPLFEFFINIQKISDTIKLAEKLYNEFKDLNIALSRLFLELAKDKIALISDKFSDILKTDVNYRKKGWNLSYLMPYISYASLYIVKYF